jgi:glutaminase
MSISRSSSLPNIAAELRRQHDAASPDPLALPLLHSIASDRGSRLRGAGETLAHLDLAVPKGMRSQQASFSLPHEKPMVAGESETQPWQLHDRHPVEAELTPLMYVNGKKPSMLTDDQWHGFLAAVATTFSDVARLHDAPKADYIGALTRAPEDMTCSVVLHPVGQPPVSVVLGETSVSRTQQSYSKVVAYALGDRGRRPAIDCAGSTTATFQQAVTRGNAADPVSRQLAMEVDVPEKLREFERRLKTSSDPAVIGPLPTQPLNSSYNIGALQVVAEESGTNDTDPGGLRYRRRYDELLGRLADDGSGTCGPLRVDDEVMASEYFDSPRNLLYALKAVRETHPELTDEEALAAAHNVYRNYIHNCSIRMTAAQMATITATLSNGGVNPFTHERVLSPETAAATLAQMGASGMYESTAALRNEVPDYVMKSGVGGSVAAAGNGLSVVIWSTGLDQDGNSRLGKEFMRRLSRHPDHQAVLQAMRTAPAQVPDASANSA